MSFSVRRDVAHVAEHGHRQRPGDVGAHLGRQLPEREAARPARSSCAGLKLRSTPGSQPNCTCCAAVAGLRNGTTPCGATPRRGKPRLVVGPPEKNPRKYMICIVVRRACVARARGRPAPSCVGRGPRSRRSSRARSPVLRVVRRPEEADGAARRERHALRERQVRAHLGLHADVGRGAAEDAARDLQRVAEIDARVRLDRRCRGSRGASISSGYESTTVLERRDRARCDVRERVLDLDVVGERDVELLPERALDARSAPSPRGSRRRARSAAGSPRRGAGRC